MQGQAAVSPDWPGARIPEFVRDLTTAAVAVMSRDGILLDGNRGFFDLLPESMMAGDCLDVRDLFIRPGFDQFAVGAGAGSGVLYRGILNVGKAPDAVHTLQGALYALTDGVLLVAELEVAGLQLLRMKVSKLTDDLADEQRKLAEALNEARAAIRCRDEARAALKQRVE